MGRVCSVAECPLPPVGEVVVWREGTRGPLHIKCCAVHLDQAFDTLARLVRGEHEEVVR